MEAKHAKSKSTKPGKPPPHTALSHGGTDTHLHDVYFKISGLVRAKLSWLKRQASAPADAGVVQCLGDEKSECLRGTAHTEPVRQAEALEVQVLEVIVAFGGKVQSVREVRSLGVG